MEYKKYDDLLESFMLNSSCENELKKVQYTDRYKIYDIEIHPVSETISSAKKCSKRKIFIVKKIFVFVLLVCLVLCFVIENLDTVTLSFYKLQNSVISNFSETDTQMESWSIEENTGTLYNMKPEIWKNLSYDERLQTIDNVKNIELYYHGVPFEVDLVINDIDDYTLGKYNHKSKTITIDTEHFNNSCVKDIVKTICHECRHAYQYACIEAYNDTDKKYKELNMFETSKELMANSLNYIKYNVEDENYYEYSTQLMERDAFSYSEQATEEYYSKLIPEYASEQ